MEEYRRLEDNIKMDLKEIGVDVMSWVTSGKNIIYCRYLKDEALVLQVS